ncbi:MAG: 3-deoxy-7-phosphoheptulonate synthase [Desulfococcaceae bacterium]
MGRIDAAATDGAGSRPVSRAELETESALAKGRGAKIRHAASRTTAPLATPAELRAGVCGTETARWTVAAGREAVRRILAGNDQRLLVVAGPCSVHDEVAALDYAGRLRELSERVADTLLLVMRAYVEKPRTHLGWKGLAVDPRLDGSDDLGEGLLRSRRLFTAINAMGLPVATEFVGPATPAYLGDLVSWAAIGARTTESQTHREMASGLPCPAGFKNATDGRLAPAINGIRSARSPHQFPGLTPDGRVGLVRTEGNLSAHLVLRGGRRPNHDLEGVAEARNALSAANLPTRLVVDCSHGNSGKDHRRQPGVLRELVARRAGGERDIAGVMLESFLVPGKQALSAELAKLRYGQSVTDGCIGWDETEALLLEARERLRSAGKVIPFSQREPGEGLLWTGS